MEKGINEEILLEDQRWMIDENSIVRGIHIMTGFLLAVCVGATFRMNWAHAVLHIVACAVFAAIYFVGFDRVDSWRDFNRQLWAMAATSVWILEMLVAPVGIYLIFALYFILLRAMPDVRGTLSVIFVTAIAVVVQVPNGLTLGGVMGPSVSAAVVLAMFYAVMNLIQATRDREAAVKALMATRHQLAEAQRAEGVAAERERLAHEIHDTVAQGLSSIQMLLHVAQKDVNNGNTNKALDRIELARSTASDNLAEARAMIAALQPAALKEHSLEAALTRMVDSFAGAGSIDISVEVDGEKTELPMKTEAALLRIAQGAVGNVAKHAKATACRVTITYAPGEVRLDVVDNGQGFDPQAVEGKPAGLGHVGLSAMRTRAAELGGELNIESQPGGPTAVSVALPLQNDEPREQYL